MVICLCQVSSAVQTLVFLYSHPPTTTVKLDVYQPSLCAHFPALIPCSFIYLPSYSRSKPFVYSRAILWDLLVLATLVAILHLGLAGIAHKRSRSSNRKDNKYIGIRWPSLSRTSSPTNLRPPTSEQNNHAYHVRFFTSREACANIRKVPERSGHSGTFHTDDAS